MRPYLIPLGLVVLIELILSFRIALAEERLENVALREYQIKDYKMPAITEIVGENFFQTAG